MDLTVRRKLSNSTCSFVGSTPYVCCLESSISKERVCNLEEGEGDDEECGVVQLEHGLRCAGCNSTSPGAWPWMVRLLYPSQGRGDTNCGGVLVSSRHVITAGHCIQGREGPDKAVLGESDISAEYDCLDVEGGCQDTDRGCYLAGLCAPRSVEVPIRGAVTHPAYDYCAGCVSYQDIAVIILDDLVTFSSFIQPVCLPVAPVEGALVLTGWGNTRAGLRGREPATVLQQLPLLEVPLEKCQEIWRTDLRTSQVCASSGTPGQAPCQGDSGGPLVRLVDRRREVWELAGVVSFGPSVCGNVDHPVVFTRISGQIQEWVKGVVRGKR